MTLLFGRHGWAFVKHEPNVVHLARERGGGRRIQRVPKTHRRRGLVSQTWMRFAHEPHKIVIELFFIALERAAGALERALRLGGRAPRAHGGEHGGEHDSAGDHVVGEGHAPAVSMAVTEVRGGAASLTAGGAESHEAAPSERSSGSAASGSHRSDSRGSSGSSDSSSGGSSGSSSGGSSSVLREGRALARARVKTTSAAMLFVYAAWAICTWMIFVYGRLIYQLLGSKSEAAFVESWGIAIGIENASGFQEARPARPAAPANARADATRSGRAGAGDRGQGGDDCAAAGAVPRAQRDLVRAAY